MHVVSFLGFHLFFCYSVVKSFNVDPASRQLENFKQRHPKPIGTWTYRNGAPVDFLETDSLNSDLLTNGLFLDEIEHFDHAKIPERTVHAKGAGAFGYFEVTNDISRYCKADLFQKVGKVTPIAVRFSSTVQNTGGSDLERDPKGFAIKFYTTQGNLDLVGLHLPVFRVKDPLYFPSMIKSLQRNPATFLYDQTATFDMLTQRPESLHQLMYSMSDYGIPRGYRKMDGFNIHAYEIYNSVGEVSFAKFNFRTEQGLENYTTAEATLIKNKDLDAFTRDLYDAIGRNDFPCWRMEMDIMTKEDLSKLDYDAFDVTRNWVEGTYKTISIGRIVLNKNPKNYFAQVEQIAMNPGSLVPGISDPPEHLFKARKLSYPDSIRNRIGINFERIKVNCPMHALVYTRDGSPPVGDNMDDAPNYFPNSFNGPKTYLDAARPKEKYSVKQSSTVDLKPAADFYNRVLKNDEERQRMADNFATDLAKVADFVVKRAIDLFSLTDPDFGRRVKMSLCNITEHKNN